MKKRFQLVLSFLLIVISLFGKSRVVDIVNELKYAQFIGIVEIQEYYVSKNDSIISELGINYANMIQKLRLKTIVGDSIFYSTTSKSEMLIPNYSLIDYQERETYTGYWPNKGDTVLVVIDSLNNISVFGIKIDDYYRIWSPYLTGSTATFRIKEPIKPLSLDDANCYNLPLGKSCWDGCLLHIEAIRQLIGD